MRKLIINRKEVAPCTKQPKQGEVYSFKMFFSIFLSLYFFLPVTVQAQLSSTQLSIIDEIELAMQKHLSAAANNSTFKEENVSTQSSTDVQKKQEITEKKVVEEDEKDIEVKQKQTESKDKKKSLIVSYCLNGSYEKLALRAKKYQKFITTHSQKYDVSESLVKAVITAESCFNNSAESPKGAQGLMQLMPATAKRFGVKDSFDANSNIKAGTRYLKFLMDHYDDDLLNAIAAYNAGEGAVDKYQGIPPYNETRVYVSKVASLYKLYAQGGGQLSSSSVASSSNEELQESIFIPRAMPTSRFSPYKKRTLNISKGECDNRTSKRLMNSTLLEHGDGIWQRMYTAMRGDTLTRVMQRTGIHKRKIAQMNGLRSRVKLKEGQQILVWECRQ